MAFLTLRGFQQKLDIHQHRTQTQLQIFISHHEELLLLKVYNEFFLLSNECNHQNGVYLHESYLLKQIFMVHDEHAHIRARVRNPLQKLVQQILKQDKEMEQ